jgi:thiaminase/transcriptional activator TenA
MAGPTTTLAGTLASNALREELDHIVTSSAEQINEHPYYQGMRDGSLPAVVFAHYLLQDSIYVLPSYGKALARCAALVRHHQHAQLLSRMGTISLDSAASTAEGFPQLAERLGLRLRQGEARPPVSPTTLALSSFYTAATVGSPVAAVGALLPSAWLWMLVMDDLLERHDPASRYAEVISTWHPGTGYRQQIDDLLTLVDEVAADSSTAERADLVANVNHAARYEVMSVDAAWRLEPWPF